MEPLFAGAQQPDIGTVAHCCFPFPSFILVGIALLHDGHQKSPMITYCWLRSISWVARKPTVEPDKSLWQELGVSGLQLWTVAQNTHVLILAFKLSFLLGSGLSTLVLKTFMSGTISPYALERGGDTEGDFTASCATKITMPPPSDP